MPRFISFVVFAVGVSLQPTSGFAATVPAWAAPGALMFADEAQDVERAMLAIPPPQAIPADALMKTLPRGGKKLLGGEPFTILAIGDSVTATGPYPEILKRLLARATGNGEIRVMRAAYSGRSVDAAVRRFEKDALPAKADLALIMFGLNDQAAGAPLEAYLEQTRWLVERLRAQGADVVLLEPTPHINITRLPTDKYPPPPDASIFRTVGFAAALRELGRGLDTPVAPTFDALWGEGAVDLQRTAKALWPLFPTHYSKPFTSLVETEGRGDTIHPNAQGHLRLAQAVLATLAGRSPVAPLHIEAQTRVGDDGRLVSGITVRNDSPEARRGQLAVYPFAQDDTHELQGYELAKGASCELTFVWPATVRPGETSWLQIVDYHGAGSRALAVAAPLTPEMKWVRERRVANEPKVTARFLKAGEVREVPVAWPDGSAVGRVPLTEEAVRAELAYVRYGAARSGEAVADGALDEWTGANWIPVGEPVQARWTQGPADFRTTPAECYLNWAFKAGHDGVWLAFRSTGELAKDRFTLYFDNRSPAELGTAGPYTWIDGAFKADGTLSLKAGDSSREGGAGLSGRWRALGAAAVEGELFVPYGVLNTARWPESGDLGVSIVWMHTGADGRVTRLLWSENGHPWNTRWFGVVRRDPTGPLPWRVRIQ
ncbi:MAG: SGNH/GDSL hydrolase family protein [Rariglobus sp.]